jgi:hypothetical protein
MCRTLEPSHGVAVKTQGLITELQRVTTLIKSHRNSTHLHLNMESAYFLYDIFAYMIYVHSTSAKQRSRPSCALRTA